MDFYIGTDKDQLDISAIHQYISTTSYWGKGRTMEDLQKTLDHCLCFGMYLRSGTQIGFARVLTDHVVFAYLMDIFIFDEYQGKGLGKELIGNIMGHPLLKNVKTMALKTKDAHALYERFGFQTIGDSELWMYKDNVVYS